MTDEGLVDEGGDVVDLDARVRLNDATEVLLEQVVVEGAEVRLHDGIVQQLRAVLHLSLASHTATEIEVGRDSTPISLVLRA